MRGVLKAIGILLLIPVVAAVAVVVDGGWNGGRLFATLLGRDRLIAQCLPPLRTDLAGRGFTPTDVEMRDPVSVGVAADGWGASRVLSGPFTFSDGPNGMRVDGELVCRVSGSRVVLEVAVEGRPVRAA